MKLEGLVSKEGLPPSFSKKDLIVVMNKIEDPSGGYTKHWEKSRSNLYIQDSSGKEFPINPWCDLIHQFRSDQLLECKETTINIVCALSIRIYDEDIHGSSMSASKFFLKLDVPEAAEYLSRYKPLNMVPQLFCRTHPNSSMHMVVQEAVQSWTVEDLLNAPSVHMKVYGGANCLLQKQTWAVRNAP